MSKFEVEWSKLNKVNVLEESLEVDEVNHEFEDICHLKIFMQQTCLHAIYRSNRVHDYLRQSGQSENWCELYLKVQRDYDNEDWGKCNTTAWNMIKKITCSKNFKFNDS
jgi:hypothetical protein